MTTAPVVLTLEILSEDGASTEFLQDDEEGIARTLRLLATPRLFAPPLLVLASPHGISLIPCRTISPSDWSIFSDIRFFALPLQNRPTYLSQWAAVHSNTDRILARKLFIS